MFVKIPILYIKLTFIYEIFNSKDMTEVYQPYKLNENKHVFPQVIREILNKKVLPYLKYLTRFIEDFKINSTSNIFEKS